ncbi:hypothetical protein [Corynebacterium variabile]|uniref:hypothetical protein n=1 Tax=Corynebacterium variabile TaxID=1727 RepID=UPI00289BF074|nr:hypothetical protein [Corynebacterium variabile]
MKITVPPSPTGLYILCRSTVDLDFGTTNASVRHRMNFISGWRKARRHVGRAIRRDYFPPVVRELHDFQLHTLGAGIRHAVEAVQ